MTSQRWIFLLLVFPSMALKCLSQFIQSMTAQLASPSLGRILDTDTVNFFLRAQSFLVLVSIKLHIDLNLDTLGSSSWKANRDDQAYSDYFLLEFL